MANAKFSDERNNSAQRCPEGSRAHFSCTYSLNGDFWHSHVNDASNYKGLRAVVVRGNRLLHQIGGSRAHDDHDSDRHKALHMEEHHLPIWHPLILRHQQRPAIRGQRFGKVLQKIWHQAAYVHAEISSRQ
ncbi:hypothetical protein ACFX1W_019643 [Malus domestica]